MYIYTIYIHYTHTHTHTHKHTHTMEYELVMKKNESLPLATTWTELEGIMLSEINQRKTNIIRFHSYVEFNKQAWDREREANQETDS